MRLTPPFIDGVLLALGSLPDACAIIDSPRCEMERAFTFDSLHDWGTHLAGHGPYARNRRVFANDWREGRQVTGTEDRLRETIVRVANRLPGRPILIERGLMSMFLHTDLPGIAASMSEELSNPLLVIDHSSPDDDWVDGWHSVQEAVLNHIVGPEGTADTVITNYCMHRQEGDEFGNLLEIHRLMNSLEIPDPAWPLAGQPLEGMQKVSQEATRISFGFGEPTREQCRKEGQQLDLTLPIGFEGTSAFLRTLANHYGCRDAAEAIIEEQHKRLGERIINHVTRTLTGRGAVVVGDPQRVHGLCGILRELGMDVPLVVLLRRPDAEIPGRERFEAAGTEILVFPDAQDVARRLASAAKTDCCHVVVGSGIFRDAARAAGLPMVETAMPFRLEHFTASTPWMGFEGMVVLADRLGNAVARGTYEAKPPM